MIKTAPLSTLSPQIWPLLLLNVTEDYFLGVDIRLYQLDKKFVSLQNHLAFSLKSHMKVPLS